MSQTKDYETEVITDQSDPLTTQNYYNQWSEQYEKDMEVSQYNAPKYVVEAFVQLKMDPNLRILDVLAGTGLAGQLLKSHGYENIDAIDGSENMMKMAQAKKIYKNYYVALVGPEHRAPIDNETYDIIITCGSFAPGHMYADCFPELLRMLKKDGIIAWSMRQGYEKNSPKFASFHDEVEKLVRENKWRFVVPRKEVAQYLLGSNGYVYIMQKL